MSRIHILRYASIGLATVGLGLGVAAADSSIDNTGPNSENKIKVDNSSKARFDNDNDVNVKNNNDQHAYSGDARVSGNTTGGDAESGDASNDNSFDTDVSVSNSSSVPSGFWSNGSGDASINETGPHSENRIEVKNRNELNVRNDNDVRVENKNDQRASSGDARVSGNTTGGDAVSGSASNSNSSSTSVNVSN